MRRITRGNTFRCEESLPEGLDEVVLFVMVLFEVFPGSFCLIPCFPDADEELVAIVVLPPESPLCRMINGAGFGPLCAAGSR